MGFLFIYDKVIASFENIKHKRVSDPGNVPKNNDPFKRINIFKYLAVVILFICFIASPIFLAAKNYKEADLSEPLEIYVFWNNIFDHIEDGSVLYVVSSSSNIGEFISIYERPEKKITYITHKDDRYNSENIYKDLEEGKKIYFVNIEEDLIADFNIKKIFSYYWERMDEDAIFYDYGGIKKDIKIVNDFKQKDFKFGEKFRVEYRIINDNNTDAEITSIELSISDNLDLLGVDQEGTVALEPSISRGMYMWVKTFPIKANDEINIILLLQCASLGKAEIDFKITSQNIYFETEIIEMDISN